MNYICTKRFHDLSLSGPVNIPYGTPLDCEDNLISLNGKPITYADSNNGRTFFSPDDDGHGLERGKIIHEIKTRLERKTNHQERWNRLWDDETANGLRNQRHEDFWCWGHEFYTASMDDLNHIWNLIKGV